MIMITTLNKNRRFLLILMMMVLGSDATKILLVGDSMSEYMGKTLESFCEGSTVGNAGIGGTTAEDWSEYDSDAVEDCMGGSDDMPWDVVYIAIGGNDILNSYCGISAGQLKNRIEDAITNIATVVAPGASTYVMTGYCMPAATEERRLRTQRRSLCSAPSDYASLSEVINDLSPSMPNGATLKVFDSIDLCGGSTTSFSDEMYFQDPIHLNSKGYCKVFTPDAVQNALKCGTSEPIDCDSFNTEIYGLDAECDPGDNDDGNDDSTNCLPEKKEAKFWTGKTKIKNGKEKKVKKTKNCKWLKKKSKSKRDEYCDMMEGYNSNLPPARGVCTETCNSCP